MENKIRYTLGSRERLKSRKAIDRLFKEGRSFSVFPFRILYLLASPGPLADNNAATAPVFKAGFSVSSRNFKRAVDRNRVKRLMREAYRLQKNELQSFTRSSGKSLEVFFIYVGKTLPEYELLYEKTTAILEKLNRIISERK